mgnify:CR=1 FL=1
MEMQRLQASIESECQARQHVEDQLIQLKAEIQQKNQSVFCLNFSILNVCFE